MNPTAPTASDTVDRVGRDEIAIGREVEAIATAMVGSDAQHAFLTTGYVQVAGLWTTRLGGALAHEARSGRSFARRPPLDGEGEPITGAPSGQLILAQAPLLAAVHVSLTRVAQVLSAKMVVPTRGVYNYYERDAGCFLHVDTDDADITLLALVLGQLGPLHLHPDLVGAGSAQLAVLDADPTWDRDCGETIHHPRLGVAAIRGRGPLPHHRPSAPLSGLAAVAALHYRARSTAAPPPHPTDLDPSIRTPLHHNRRNHHD